MPWFVKTLNETDSDDIELIICGYNDHLITVQALLSTLLNFTSNDNFTHTHTYTPMHKYTH